MTTLRRHNTHSRILGCMYVHVEAHTCNTSVLFYHVLVNCNVVLSVANSIGTL